jgi:glycerol-3-phosphate cytidylyltransferase
MRTGFAPGVWDLLHVGHVRFLKHAADMCDALIVGGCSDACTLASKGSLPVDSEGERMVMVTALGCVSGARIYTDVDQSTVLADARPDVLFLGPEYGDTEAQQATLRACRELGVAIHVIQRTPGISTTGRSGEHRR